MNCVTFWEPVTVSFRKSAGGATLTFDAGRDYIFANAQLDRIMQEENVKSRIYKISRLDSRIPNFHVAAKKPGNQRLLMYNGSGGYGDQIITWPVTRILAGMGYEVHMAVDPGNQVCWWNIPWVKSLQTLPIQAAQFWMYDYFYMMDHVNNMDEHQDQEHPVDTMLRKIGIDPKQVPDDYKVLRPIFTATEAMSARSYEGQKFGIYQLAAANKTRSLPALDSAFLLAKLAEAFPDLTWLAIYDEFIPKEYCEACMAKAKDADGKELLNEKNEPIMKVKWSNVQLFTARNLREMWSITRHAKIVVSPDSMMVHVAGSMAIPCVGLWGMISPHNRVKYYKNHLAIHNKEACPMSPCFSYLANFPKYCPPRKDRIVCECLGAISPVQVIDAIRKIQPELAKKEPAKVDAPKA